MTLTDHYRTDMAGLTGDQRKSRQRLWHNAARRYCNLQSVTADPLPSFLTEDVKDQHGRTLYTITIKPADAMGVPLFLKAPLSELIDLYRVSKPARKKPPVVV